MYAINYDDGAVIYTYKSHGDRHAVTQAALRLLAVITSTGMEQGTGTGDQYQSHCTAEKLCKKRGL